MDIGVLITAATVVTRIPLNWCPESIFYTAATQLTSLRVDSIDNGTIINLDGTGLTSFGVAGHVDRVTNSYLIPIANGKINSKKIELVFTNSAAQTPTIFAPTTGLAPPGAEMFIQAVQQQALAASGLSLIDFSRAYFPGAAAADVFEITFQDGLTYRTTREELQAILAVFNSVANGAADYMIDNTAGLIKLVQFTPAATQTIYVQRYQSAAKNIVLTQEV